VRPMDGPVVVSIIDRILPAQEVALSPSVSTLVSLAMTLNDLCS
jgi:hypothetical protein